MTKNRKPYAAFLHRTINASADAARSHRQITEAAVSVSPQNTAIPIMNKRPGELTDQS